MEYPLLVGPHSATLGASQESGTSVVELTIAGSERLEQLAAEWIAIGQEYVLCRVREPMSAHGTLRALAEARSMWIASVRLEVASSTSLHVALATDPRVVPTRTARFSGVVQLELRPMGSDWRWDLEIYDISDRGLEGVNFRVSDGQSGRLSFSCETAELFAHDSGDGVH